MTVKTCTHRCEACGEGHYAEHTNNFRSRCRSCDTLVRLIYDPEIEQEVKLLG